MSTDRPMTIEQVDGLMDNLLGRPITVYVSAAHERRLRRSIDSFNREVPDDPVGYGDADLAIVLCGSSTRGLERGEDEDGVWTDARGHVYPLPRRVRSSLRLRLTFAWRAALTTWRAS